MNMNPRVLFHDITCLRMMSCRDRLHRNLAMLPQRASMVRILIFLMCKVSSVRFAYAKLQRTAGWNSSYEYIMRRAWL
jgi:hypothetical protein